MVTSCESRKSDQDPLTEVTCFTTYCNQECTTCGRTLRIRIEYLGHELVCPHCQRNFSTGPAALRHPRRSTAASVLERANRLLAMLEHGGDERGSDGPCPSGNGLSATRQGR